MKTHKVLFLALLVSAAFALSAQAGDRHRSNGNARSTGSAPARYSGPAIHSSSGFRYGGNRTFAPSPRMSMRPNTFSQRQTFSGGNAPIVHRQFTPRTLSNGNGLAQFQNNRPIQTNRFARFGNNNNLGTVQGNRVNRFANNNRGFNRTGTGNHVFSRRSADWHRDWDRRSDHWWNGHRCRFVNGSWFIFDFGFVPWYGWSYYDSYPYDYYPYGYGGYGYGTYGYDPGVYDQSNYYDQGGNNYNGQSNYYDQGNSNSYDRGDPKSYDRGANALGSNEQTAANVADVQDQLTRAGYYHGKIDGVLGPETRHALVRYQSAKGLRMTGSLTMETQQSLGLAAQGTDE
jgi:hypothetical protein